MSNNEPKLNFLMLQDTLRQIAETSASVSQLIPKISFSQLDSMRQRINEINSVYSSDFFRSLNDTARQISRISVESLPDLRTPLLSVQDALLEAFAVAKPYMSPDQIQEAEEIVPDIFEPAPLEEPRKPSPKLTFEKICVLLSLLLNIISLIIYTLPNKQLEQITEQNAVQIEQNEKMYSAEEETLAALRQLIETAQDVSDALDAFDQEPDSITDAPEELSLPADDPAEIDDDLDKPAEPEDKPAEHQTCINR